MKGNQLSTSLNPFFIKPQLDSVKTLLVYQAKEQCPKYQELVHSVETVQKIISPKLGLVYQTEFRGYLVLFSYVE